MNRKGFTLVELIMVVIIIGVLAATALPQYVGFVERARAAEAINKIGVIKVAQAAYSMDNTSGYFNSAASSALIATGLGVNIASTLWDFNTTGTDNTSFAAIATRNGGSSGGTIIQLTYYNNGGSVWSGTHPGAPKGKTV